MIQFKIIVIFSGEDGAGTEAENANIVFCLPLTGAWGHSSRARNIKQQVRFRDLKAQQKPKMWQNAHTTSEPLLAVPLCRRPADASHQLF
jgi:hypothetical protein